MGLRFSIFNFPFSAHLPVDLCLCDTIALAVVCADCGSSDADWLSEMMCSIGDFPVSDTSQSRNGCLASPTEESHYKPRSMLPTTHNLDIVGYIDIAQPPSSTNTMSRDGYNSAAVIWACLPNKTPCWIPVEPLHEAYCTLSNLLLFAVIQPVFMYLR